MDCLHLFPVGLRPSWLPQNQQRPTDGSLAAAAAALRCWQHGSLSAAAAVAIWWWRWQRGGGNSGGRMAVAAAAAQRRQQPGGGNGSWRLLQLGAGSAAMAAWLWQQCDRVSAVVVAAAAW